MTKFHITRAGRAAPCEATTGACPLGEHYPSLTAAVRAAHVLDLAATHHGSSRSLSDGERPNGLPDDSSPSTLTPQPLVPFGKYRGRPVSSLLQDKGYCRWLLTQDWFQQDYPDLHRRARERQEVARLRGDFRRL